MLVHSIHVFPIVFPEGVQDAAFLLFPILLLLNRNGLGVEDSSFVVTAFVESLNDEFL